MEWRPTTIAKGLGFPEGPVWLGDGAIAFTDIRLQNLAVVDAAGARVLAATGGGPNGATLGADGMLYVANNGGLNVGPGGYWHAPDQTDGKIQRVSLDGIVEDLIPVLPDEPPHRPNDLCFGPDGALYFTDPRNWDDLAHLSLGRVWRADLGTGDVRQVGEVPMFPNGIAFGPDGRLYVAESIAMKVHAFEWRDGQLGSRTEFASLPAGFPDGFCFTADGDLIVCGSMGDVIQIFDADGALKQTIETGEHTEPTNCCIGDGILYVTMSAIGEVVAVPIDAAPLPLYPAR